MAILVAFCAVLFLASVLPLTLIAWGVARRHQLGWPLFFVAALMQILAYAWLLNDLLTDYPSAAAIVLPGFIAAGAGISAVTGLLVYIVMCLLIMRPLHWRRWLSGVGAVVAVAILLLAGPRFVARSGMTTNVDLHGVVRNVDGSPAPGARVHLGRCSYILENPVVADVEGRFQIVANCGGFLVVENIFNPQTGTTCASRFRSSDHEYLIVFDSLEGEPYSQSRPHWKGYPRDNPFVVTCAWSIPDTIERHYETYDQLPADGNPVTVTAGADRRYLDFEDGEHDGLLHVRLTTTKDAVAGSNRFALEIRPVNGGIQSTEDHEPFNIAPLDGYQPTITLDLGTRNSETELEFKKTRQTYYFHSNDRSAFGAVRISTVFGYNRKEEAFDLNPSITFDMFVNYGGSPVLLSQEARRNF